MAIFTASIAVVIGLIAARKGPFQLPHGIAEPVAKRLTIIPSG